MKKDEMTNGLGKWIKCQKFDAVVIPSFRWGTGQNEQHNPIEDEGGLGMFCREFEVCGVKNAVIDATALGVYDLYINGERVKNGDVYDELKPGWEDYKKHVLYYSYDITDYLTDGKNTVLAVTAPGWYAGRISFGSYPDAEICFMAGIHITDKNGKTDMVIKIKINRNSVEYIMTAVMEDNSSAAAFYELLQKGDVTVKMHDYGNFEKVGSLPKSLPRNDKQITTEPGDIILYQGNQITIYYDVNSWNFTKLGKIEGKSQEDLKRILGKGDVTAVFSVME